ncbi:MAG: DUF2877 domain-containing protein [Rhizobacter sp.]
MHRACCLGGRVDVWAPRCGVVHSVFAGAANLRLGEAWWTLLAADRPDQPSGIRLASDTADAPETPDARGARGAAGLPPIRAGSPVVVRAGHLRVGDAVIDCRAATRWAPDAWPVAAPGVEARLRQLERAAMRRAWAGAPALAQALCDALDDDDAALAAAALCAVGRGPGLTPSGDDVIVGLLTALGMERILLRERLARAIAPALPTTTALSRHLIEEAVIGLPGRALHELGVALLSGRNLAGAAERALEIGATSGADAVFGLIAGCRHHRRLSSPTPCA